MAGLTGVFNPSAADLQAEGYTYTVAGTEATFGIVGATDGANCKFTYTQSVGVGAAAAVSPLNPAGC
jgi:MSHA pilin protein MshA